MSATLAEVAHAAGVSKTTVSKVLNNQRHVRSTTRDRVMVAVERLGYTPSLFAQSLRNNRSHSIGVLIDRPLEYQWVAEVVGAVLGATGAAGLSAMVVQTGDELKAVAASLTNLRRRHVEGYVYVGTGGVLPAVRLDGWSVPHTYLFCQPDPPDGPAFLLDNVQAADLATSHLLDLGHRRVAFAGGPEGRRAADERRFGFRRAFERRGFRLAPELLTHGPWDDENGYSSVFDLKARQEPFTAVVAANDFIAVGALHALRVLGQRVPQDVSVVGVDDNIVARLSRPRLSTVAMPTRELGEAAARALLDGSRRPLGAFPVTRLPARLIARESTGPAPADA